MPTPIDVRYRLTRRDVVFAVASINRFSKLSAAFGAFAVIITAFSFVTGDPTWPVPALLGAGFGTGMLPGLLGAWAWSRRREICSAEINLIADATGVRTSMPMSTSSAEWAVLRRIRETPHAFLLDFGTGVATFVPKTSMTAADVAGLRSLASAAGALSGGSSWRLPAIGAGIGIALVACVELLFAVGILVPGTAPV